MLSTAQADPTPWLPLPDLDDEVDGEPAADTERANNYYRARYYDPKIGRFISEDPIGFDGGINFYAYVGNNPANWTDPSGLQSTPPPPPNVPGAPWTWHQDLGNPRGGTFSGPQGHTASWDPQGHWDVNLPGGGRQRYCPRGNPITAAQAHNPPRPGMGPIDFTRRRVSPRGTIRGLGRALGVVGLVLTLIDIWEETKRCEANPCDCTLDCEA
jgi:RHS repeat-associated protein